MSFSNDDTGETQRHGQAAAAADQSDDTLDAIRRMVGEMGAAAPSDTGTDTDADTGPDIIADTGDDAGDAADADTGDAAFEPAPAAEAPDFDFAALSAAAAFETEDTPPEPVAVPPAPAATTTVTELPGLVPVEAALSTDAETAEEPDRKRRRFALPLSRRRPRKAKPAKAPKVRRPSRLIAAAKRLGAIVATHIRRFLNRPDAPRLIAISVLAFIVVTWPGFIIGMFATAALVALIVYLSLGPDRVAMFAVERYQRLKARDPDRAEALRARAAAISRRLTSWLDRLPDSWTAGLYLPEFEEPAEPSEKMRNDPFERLASQAEITQNL